MVTKTGQAIAVKMAKTGNQVMVPRIIYLEPELWDILDRLAKSKNLTRSTYIRAVLKKQHYQCNKITGINWTEASYM